MHTYSHVRYRAGVGKLWHMYQIQPLFLDIMFNWNTTILIPLHTVCGCFQTTEAEFSVAETKTYWLTKPKIFSDPLQKSLPTLGLEDDAIVK